MPRQPRERSPIGFYHVYARGTGGLVYFEDDADHHAHLALYGRVVERDAWRIHAYCLLHTHHHVLVEAPHEALVRGMHLIGTAQAMRLNNRRDRFGHVTAGRFGSTALYAHDDVARVAIYIATNPVSAGLVDDPSEFPWVSHRATLGAEPAPPWLEIQWLPRLFGELGLGGADGYAAAVNERCANLIAARPAP
jgi:REP element-mobilizing transposase RayT